MKHRIQWTNAEKNTVFAKVVEIRKVLPEISWEKCLKEAVEVLPEGRRRPLDNNSAIYKIAGQFKEWDIQTESGKNPLAIDETPASVVTPKPRGRKPGSKNKRKVIKEKVGVTKPVLKYCPGCGSCFSDIIKKVLGDNLFLNFCPMCGFDLQPFKA